MVVARSRAGPRSSLLIRSHLWAGGSASMRSSSALACDLALGLRGGRAGAASRAGRRASSRTRSRSPRPSSRGPCSERSGGPGSSRGQASSAAAASSRSSRAICARRPARASRSSTSGRTSGAVVLDCCHENPLDGPSRQRTTGFRTAKRSGRLCADFVVGSVPITMSAQSPRGEPPGPRGRRRMLVLPSMPRNDPTDTGGLFIGRRPGTAPLRYPARSGARRRAAPAHGLDARRRRARAGDAGVPDARGGRSRSRGCGSARRSTTARARSRSASRPRSRGCWRR